MPVPVARRQPLYGEAELRYLKDYLERLLEKTTARAPTRREVGFRVWLIDGLAWLREDPTGALTLERPAVHSNGRRPRTEYQLRLGDGARNL